MPSLKNSWNPQAQQEMIAPSLYKPTHSKNVIDDGFFSSMALGAEFESLLEIPIVKSPKHIVIPEGAVPFSQLDKALPGDCPVFFENDLLFSEFITSVELFFRRISEQGFSATPDCSVYRDMPFLLQCLNIYLSRLVGHHMQRLGIGNIYPTVRWGDERTYEPFITDKPIAFIGLSKHKAYWIGSYGVCKTREEKHHLREGLKAAVKWLHPSHLFIYGGMPDEVFSGIAEKTIIVQYPDWTTRQHTGCRRR